MNKMIKKVKNNLEESEQFLITGKEEYGRFEEYFFYRENIDKFYRLNKRFHNEKNVDGDSEDYRKVESRY
jgi:hypothetical protein